jgi:plasmid maintenance system antidote protein VapI
MSEERLRLLVRDIMKQKKISQRMAAETYGVTQKQLSFVMTGRAQMTMTWAERLLSLCGMQLIFDVVPAPSKTKVKRTTGT